MLVNPNISLPSASLIKRLAAMLYDSFLILAILFVATIIALLFNKGEAIESSPVFTLYLVLVIFLFYSWFWSKCGQTLGMRVWKIQIINDYGRNPAWQVCILRLVFAVFSMACLGLGYWWRLFKPYTWHDKLSQTRIIDISGTP
ncbi:MAG: RDD family protein [Gammaproteobacteria bacterium]|nr:MAG: RDD family protein [Gammaproteobacteria bacterium]